MKEKKKLDTATIVWLVLLLLGLAFSVYVVVSKIVTKHEQEAQFEQASENAVRYVREKYGFDAEVIGTRDGWSYGDDMKNMGLKMKYGDKEFYVFASCTEESSKACDDYQWDEISAAVESYVNEALPGGKIVCLNLSESQFLEFLMYTYFDGNNIEQILSSCDGRIEMVFADTDFSESDMPQKLYDLGITPEFTSFDTLEHMDEFLDRIENNNNYKHYQLFAPYITDHISIDDGKTERLDLHFMQTDDFEYCYFPAEWNSFSESSDKVKVEPSNKGKLGEIFGKYSEEYALAKPLSKEYYFDGIYGDLRIFIPLERLSGYDLEKVGVAWFSASGIYNDRDISRAEICGNYAVFNLPFGEDSFMLVDNSGQEEYVPAWKD